MDLLSATTLFIGFICAITGAYAMIEPDSYTSHIYRCTSKCFACLFLFLAVLGLVV